MLYGKVTTGVHCDVCASVAQLAADYPPMQEDQDMSCSVKEVRLLVADMASGGSAVRAGGLSRRVVCRLFN